jgi:C_GCAxxG_C_C family probable redox protein
MPDADLIRSTRDLFLRDDNTYGCAESAFVALQQHFGFPDAEDSSPAMALNGGVAYSGGACGAVTGVALAVGRLAEQRLDDHRLAKKVARRIIQQLTVDFREEFGSLDCRDLTGYDMIRDHEEFIESGVWRDGCMRQIEFTVSRLAPLLDEAVWEAEAERVAALEEEIG